MTEYRDPSFPAIFRKDARNIREFDRFLLQILDEWNQNIRAILEKGISLDDNVDMVDIEYTSNATPDTEDTVSHNLGKTPTGFLVYSIDKGGVVYNGTTSWDADNIYLKCTTASTEIKAKVF